MVYLNLVQYIEKYNLSSNIIVSDAEAWLEYPDYQFIYNKLWIAQSQFLETGPMNVYPNKYPVIFKPIINLIGMSRGIKIINSEEEYDLHLKDGFFWEEFLEGDHWCIDLILNEGKIIFYSALLSHSDINGSFKYHESLPDFKLPEHIILWIDHFLNNYTGCLNLEIINGKIIEAHLRLNGDFHLYNKKFVTLLSQFFEGGNVSFESIKIKKLFLIPIFVNKDFDNKKNKKQIKKYFKENNINNIFYDQINSKIQSEYLSRLVIYSTNNIYKGLKIKENFIKIFINNNINNNVTL